MRRYLKLALALLLGLVLVVAFWVWHSRAEPFMPLLVDRQMLGQLPLPSPGMVDNACLTDLDGDGEPDLLVLYTEFLRTGRARSFGIWRESVSGTQSGQPLPVIPVLPTITHKRGIGLVPFEAGNSPLLRELIGFDPSTNLILKVRRQNGQWQVAPVEKLQGEQFNYALWFDVDEDGSYDDALLLTQSGKLVWLEIDTHGMWHLRTMNPSLIPTQALDSFQNVVQSSASLRASHHAPAAFAMPRLIRHSLEQGMISDIDGDGQSERLTKWGIRLSRKEQTIPLREPGWIRDAVFVDELDGKPPLEIISIWVQHTPSLAHQLTVDRFDGSGFRRVASWMAPARARTLVVWCRDLEGDGRAEIILADSVNLPKATLRWRLLRLEKGQFQQQSHTQPLPEPVVGTGQISLPNAIALEAVGVQSRRRWFWEPPRREDYTLLAGLPQGAAAADPSQWDTLVVADLDVDWAGDYDGDGKGEIVLKNLGPGEEILLLQYRENRWHGKKLSSGRRLITALPAHIKGQPRLILVYQDKGIEIESLAIPREK